MCFKRKKKSDSQQTKDRLRQLTAVSELATTEYTIAKIIKPIDLENWYPSKTRIQKKRLGKRKLLYLSKIYVKAGLDLNKYDPKKTEFNETDKSITIVLPHARVLSFDMPIKEIIPVYGDAQEFSLDEKEAIQKKGEESVRAEIQKPEFGILESAEKNAIDIFKATLMQLGYESINIQFE